MKFARLIAVMAVMIAMTACSTSSGNLTNNISFKKDISGNEESIIELEDAVNMSGLNILKQRVKNNNDGNVIVSPVSIFCALSLLANGADGNTKKEIEKAFCIESFEQQKLNENINRLMNTMNRKRDGENTGSINIYNSIWFNKGFTIKDSFLSAAKSYYNSDVFKKDFSRNSTVKDMNEWASKKSDGLINKPFKELTEQERIVLINLLNFKGKWINEFDKQQTKEDNFYLKDNTSIKVDMMNKEGMMSYYEDDEVKSGILNYYNGRMIVLLPKGNIDEYINHLSTKKIKSYTENASNSIVQLKFPKFNLEYKEDMSDILKQMGIKHAFNPAQASFKMLHEDSEPLWLGSVLHDCVIRVDEEGTSGAALTALDLCGAAPPKGSFELYINKPFLFIIQDQSGTCLFIGKVDNIMESM